jgi:hypothetical protein
MLRKQTGGYPVQHSAAQELELLVPDNLNLIMQAFTAGALVLTSSGFQSASEALLL